MALHLILDSQKKTQPFTDKELELMKYFITYNIKTEKPSAKQKNLSFVKKVCVYKNNVINKKRFIFIKFFISDAVKNERKSVFCSS